MISFIVETHEYKRLCIAKYCKSLDVRVMAVADSVSDVIGVITG